MSTEVPYYGIVGWDKDSTLCRTNKRHWMVPDILAGKRSWPEYSKACLDDEPVLAARQLMIVLAMHYRQVVMSGASDCPEARAWLRLHGFPVHEVYFRDPADVDTGNAELKVRWIRELNARGGNVFMFVEDDPDVASEITRETGVPVLVLNPCYEEEIAAVRAVRGGKLILLWTMQTRKLASSKYLGQRSGLSRNARRRRT